MLLDHKEILDLIKKFLKDQIRKTGLVRVLEKENEELIIQIKDSQNEVNNLKIQNKNLEEEKLIFLEEKIKIENLKEKFRTIPNFEDLKLTLKGKDGYLFLINDSNNEIRQHFDQSYINNFNPNFFIERLKSKIDYCNKNNIKYFFFIVPDKSYVCRDFLPFDIKIIKRNYDLIKQLGPDLSEKLDHTCYSHTDSHINFLGGKELSYHILNYIDNQFKREDFDKLIKEQIDFNLMASPYYYDLTSQNNWSYSDEELVRYLNEKSMVLNNKFLKDLKDSIPEKFKLFYKRETNYYLNEKGFTNFRVLILHDSSISFLKEVLSIYCKELLCYWDHWYFNKELIEWYKPDIILEIRTERFLECMESQLMYIEGEINNLQ